MFRAVGALRAVGVAGWRGRKVAGVAMMVKCIVGNLIFLDEIAFCSIKMSTTNLKGWMLSYCQKL